MKYFIPSHIKYALNIFILAADVEGSLEALLDVIASYNSQLCRLDVVNFDVGAVSKSDIALAELFDGRLGIMNYCFFFFLHYNYVNILRALCENVCSI